MIQHKNSFIWGILGVLTLASCEKEVIKPDPSEVKNVNAWIYETMDKHYLWYDELPDIKTLDMKLDPEEFFRNLLSDKDGKFDNGSHYYFSSIEKKEAATKANFMGDTSYGFYAAALSLKNNTYLAEVLFVLPDSPAAEAGLERGDWIIGFNGQTENIKDPDILMSGGALTLQLARYDTGTNTFHPTRTLQLPAARKVEYTPFLKDTVYQEGGKKIAYLLYNTFDSGPDGYKDDRYNQELKNIFSHFKAQQATEMILDLRYNGGGYLTCATLMASLLAPAQALGKDFAHLTYNGRSKNNNSTYKLETAASVGNENLNLSRLYVLTSGQTASASEAVINGLYPYMGKSNITLIGTKTLGKNVGSALYGEDEAYGWLLHPITFHIFNTEDRADYANGFNPDIELDELYISVVKYPTGDPRDLLIDAAIREITGKPRLRSVTTDKEGIRLQYAPPAGNRNGLIVPEEMMPAF